MLNGFSQLSQLENLSSNSSNISPQKFFLTGNVGFALDPSILSSLSQDDTGATPVTAAGQSVGRIMDQSGGARHATQATAANKPTYRVGADGRPYLEFDGGSDLLNVASMSLAAGGRTVITALTRRNDLTAKIIVETAPVWTTLSGGFTQATDPTTAGAFRSGINTTTGTSATAALSYAVSTPLVFSSRYIDGTQVARINGVQVFTNNPTGTIAALNAPFTIGGRTGITSLAAIDLFAMIVIDRALTTAEMAQAEAWAASRCGIKL